MVFKLQNLKNFLYSIKNKKVEEIYLKNNNIEILININKNNYKIHSDLKKKFIINKKEKITDYKQNISKKTKNQNLKQQTNNNTLINDKIINNEESQIYSTIISPMVGTFYRAPAPNEAPFIEKNNIVNKKQTVCIIEAMKLMNEIESEVKGEIIEILVNDGDIVDCGQALMKVKII